MLFVFGGLASLSNVAKAQTEPPQFITVDGRLYDSTTPTEPLLDGSVQMRIQVLNPAKTCILYEEQQTVSTISSNGFFNVRVGSPTSGPDSAKRTALDVGNTMATVFQNQSAPIAGNSSGGMGCSYTPSTGETRYFRFIVTPSTTGVTSQLSPDMTVDSVPQALVAESVQGMLPDAFIQVSADVTQAKLESLLGTSYTTLTSLLGGTSTLYLRNTTNGTVIPSRPTDPAAPVAGQIWYDSATNELKYYDGTTVQALSSAGGGDPTKLPLAGGTMTGAINMGSNDITSVGHITQSAQRTMRFGGYTGGQEGVLVGSLLAGQEGTTWYNTTTDKIMYWDGTAATELLTANSANGLVPNCAADQSLQMSAGPIYVWSCVATTDSTKLSLAGGTMTGAINMGSNDLTSVGHMTLSAQRSLRLGRYTTAQQTTLVGTLIAGQEGTTWYNTTTNKMMYWDGTAAREVVEANMLTGLGDITEVNTNAGSGLSGGVTSGAASLQVEVDNVGLEINGSNDVQLRDGGVVTAKIADNAITSAKINNGEITNDDINATAAIAWSKIDKTGAVAGDVNAVARAGDTMTGQLVMGPRGVAAGDGGAVSFTELLANGTNTAMIRAPDALAANYVLTLPADDGAAGQVLQTDGSGLLSWTTLGAASITDDSLDFDKLTDTMNLDASTDILADNAEVLSITNTGTGNSFVVNDQAGDTTPFIIDPSGNVGIGTPAPQSTLEVIGGIRTYSVYARNNFADSTFEDNGNSDDVQNIINFTRTRGDTTPPGLGFAGQVSFGLEGSVHGTAVAASQIVWGWENAQTNATTDRDGYFSIFTMRDNASAERLRINSFGEIGIGTSSPGSRLDVAGAITSRPSGSGTGATGQLIMRELAANGTDSATIRAPDALAANYVLTLPVDDGNAGQVLQTDGSGLLSWTTLGAASITDDSLDFDKLTDTMNLDASTDILADNAEVLSITNTGTGNSFVVNDQAADTTPFVVDSNGNVGIGSSSPTYILDIDASSTVNALRVRRNTGTIATNILLQNPASTASTAGAGIVFDTGSVGAARIAGTSDGSSATGTLQFSTKQAGALTEVMRMNSSGYVGIGTTVPSSILDVAGAITSRPFGTATGETGQLVMRELAANGSDSATIRVPDALAANYVLTLPVDDGNAGQVLQTDGSGLLSWTTLGAASITDDSLDFDKLTDTMNLDASTDILADNAEVLSITNTGTGNSFVVNDQASDTTPFVVDPSGNVGVGTTAPTNELDVNGVARATRFLSGDGSANPTGYGFASSPGTGMFYSGGPLLNWATNGQSRIGLSGSAFSSAGAGGVHITYASTTNPLLPTYSWKPDTDTGMFSPVADNIGFTTNGSEKMRIDLNGNVAIGTTAPGSRLDVAGAITARPFGTATGETGQLVMRELAANGTDSATIRVPDALAANYVLTLPVDDGTTGQLLQTDGNGVLSWVSGGASLISDDSLDFDKFADTMNLDANTDILADNAEVLSITNTGTGNSFVVNDQASDTSPFVINASGSVGIGTANPGAPLDVNGSARIDGLQIRYNSFGLANSFAIGGSMSAGTANTVIGIAASTSSGANVVIGESATASGGSGVAIGRQSSVNAGGGATGSVAVGHSASATGDGAIAIGIGAIAPSSRILAFGHTIDPNLSIRESYFGSSVTSAAPQDHILNASGGSGTDIPGANLTLAGGKGTGAAPGGYIAFSTSASGASGTTLRPINERMRITTSGNVGIGTTVPGSLLDVAGAITSRPFGAATGQTGQLVLRELAANGTDSATIRVPDALAANYVLTLPVDDGTTGQLLQTDGNGVLSWVSGGASLISDDSLDFDKFADTMNLDASTDILADNAEVLSITNTGTGNSFVVNDQASDTSPFVIDPSGRVGVGTASPRSPVEIYDGLRLTFSGSGNPTGHTAVVSVDANARLTTPNIKFTGGNTLFNSQSDSTYYSMNNYLHVAATWMNGNTSQAGFTYQNGPDWIPSLPGLTGNLALYSGTINSTAATTFRGQRVEVRDNSTAIANTNVGLSVSMLGTNTSATRYAATFEGGSVGIGTTAPLTLLDVAGAITSRPFGTATGETGQFVMRELAANGTNTATVRVPDALAANYVLTLPGDDGTAGQLLQTDGNGNLTWVNTGTSLITDDTLDFDKLTDTMNLDASTTITADGAEVLSITNTGTGESFRVNDAAGDTTPFVVDANGNVGIGTTSATRQLTVYGNNALDDIDGVTVQIEQDGLGDSLLTWLVIGRRWYSGIDNSDADKFKLATTTGTPDFSTDTALTIDTFRNVGIGTTSPRSALDVNGVVLMKPAVLNATTTIDYSAGNLQFTNGDCGAFALHNMRDGGSYTFVVKGGTVATCSFTAFSDAGVTPLTVHMPVDHAATTAARHTLYTFLVMGTDLYITWMPGM